MILERILNGPKRNATRSNLKNPTSPQFIAPMITNVNAVQSNALLFIYTNLLSENLCIVYVMWRKIFFS